MYHRRRKTLFLGLLQQSGGSARATMIWFARFSFDSNVGPNRAPIPTNCVTSWPSTQIGTLTYWTSMNYDLSWSYTQNLTLLRCKYIIRQSSIFYIKRRGVKENNEIYDGSHNIITFLIHNSKQGSTQDSSIRISIRYEKDLCKKYNAWENLSWIRFWPLIVQNAKKQVYIMKPSPETTFEYIAMSLRETHNNILFV